MCASIPADKAQLTFRKHMWRRRQETEWIRGIGAREKEGVREKKGTMLGLQWADIH